MFNIFHRKKDENLISDVFKDLSVNQKMSVMNLLITISICDGDQGDQDKELQFLNTYIGILNVRQDKCMPYMNEYGHARMISDLKTISQEQKEFLVVAAWEMVICDGRPNETEMQVTANLFKQIGISEEKFVEIIEKTRALAQKFFGK
jgi:uncharacterized tellurite resistance protein B-like protein